MLVDRRTKIVATIGPATQDEASLEKAIRAGLNVARLNFSHGSHEDHLKVLKTVRRLSQELKAPVAILQDLQGPKIRVGKFEKGSIELKSGQKVQITIKKVLGQEGLIPSDFPELVQSVKAGDKILLDDGILELRVLGVQGEEVDCEVIYGGILKDRKGMNCPGVTLAVECLTEKDLEDLEFGLANDVDYVALSFVRFPKDILQLREIVQAKNPKVKICSKIEMQEAIDNLEEIVRLSDVIMVARGDLAVEIGQCHLPGVQKRIIELSNRFNRPVITATQMLESMVNNPRPTRAEITDIANAVWDGADALMLSAESASGKHPFRCIRTMHEIIREVEGQAQYYKVHSPGGEGLCSSLSSSSHSGVSGAVSLLGAEPSSIFSSVGSQSQMAQSIAASACLTAAKSEAKAIVCLTTTGQTAQMISGYRPKARLIAVTHKLSVLNQLEMLWGLQTFMISPYKSLEDVVGLVERLLIENGLAQTGDRVVLTLGQPMGQGTKTNSLHLITLGGKAYQRLPDSLSPLRCRQVEAEF